MRSAAVCLCNKHGSVSYMSSYIFWSSVSNQVALSILKVVPLKYSGQGGELKVWVNERAFAWYAPGPGLDPQHEIQTKLN